MNKTAPQTVWALSTDNSINKTILSQFRDRHGLSKSAMSNLALGRRDFFWRLENDKSFSMATIGKVQEFMNNYERSNNANS